MNRDVTQALQLLGKLHEEITQVQETLIDLQEEVETFEHEQRTWQYGLTADEWFHVACEGETSEIPPCCGNIGDIRDIIRYLMVFQALEDFGWRKSIGMHLLEKIEADGNNHGFDDPGQFPLLHKILEGIREEINLPLLPGGFPGDPGSSPGEPGSA